MLRELSVCAFKSHTLLSDAVKSVSETCRRVCSTVTGQFESIGRFEMQIGKEFDLVSMKTVETMRITDKSNNLPTEIIIVTTWAGKMNLNQTPVDAIFKVR